MNENKINNFNNWNKSIQVFLKQNNLLEYQLIFLKKFETRMEEVLSEYDIPYLGQLSEGNRLRPQIILWMSLCNIKPFDPTIVSGDSLDELIDLCVYIELIHKSTLLLDDMIDGDSTRKGITAFHVKNGEYLTSLMGLNLISKSTYNIYQIFCNINVSDSIRYKSIVLTLGTCEKLSAGAIKELRLKEEDTFNLDVMKEIAYSEVSSLLKNALLLGYYYSGGNNEVIEDIFENISLHCGFLFQLLNDLEPIVNVETNIKHKGRNNFDYLDLRKNIVVSYLGEFMTKKEKEQYCLIKNNYEKVEFINSKFEKYKIIDFSYKQVKILKDEINKQSIYLSKTDVDPVWHLYFVQILDVLISSAEDRLNPNLYELNLNNC